ncbi:MAG: arsenite methyltransferase [Deltaproteobacteria bacterium]|nr:arsenite methyltransferase [Deltaproteobacteria bacterium]
MSSHLERAVRERYGSFAKSSLSSENASIAQVARAFGYSAEELASIPAEANMGLSCGNPTAHAHLRPGETVVDLGCGGGLDVFLAAPKVGPSGKAIGIDMTPEMIERARRNAARGGADGRPFANVEFHLATIDRLPLPDASVDCVISNCVINLAPDKQAVFREIARVLRPGGRVAISDIALRKPLPEGIGADLLAYVGCVAGAIPIDAYRRGLLDAGFAHAEVLDTGSDLDIYRALDAPARSCADPAPPVPAPSCGCSSPAPREGDLRELLGRYDLNEYAASVRVFAVKPA